MVGRKPKKSETFDVRLPHEVKEALMQKARAEGRSASEVIRELIQAYLAEKSKETPTMFIAAWKPAVLAGSVVFALLWAAFAPAPVAARTDLRAAFDRLDRDRDGKVTRAEFGVGEAQGRPMARPMASAAISGPVTITFGPPGRASALASEFSLEDRDRNGFVDFDEFRRSRMAMAQASFAAADRNHDGSLDRVELQAFLRSGPLPLPRPSFGKFDRNGNGKIELSEFLIGSDWRK